MAHVPKYRHLKSRDKGYSEHNEKWVYFPGTYNSPESKRAYAAFLHNLATPSDEPVTLIKGQDITIEFLCTTFLEYAQFHYQKHGRTTGTYERYRDSVIPSLITLFGDDSVSNFAPLKLKQLRNAYVQKGWCRNTVSLSNIFERYLNHQILTRIREQFSIT
ncbi:MAG: hypothetical protein LBU65_00155 [Planctomycetaceae bacterium]|nr:hypothetical protein [Planctomycetaceae bacterium]